MIQSQRNARRPHSGFTATELSVLLGIIVVLASIFIPYAMKVRESERRTRCANNLRAIWFALAAYATPDNSGYYPRVVYDSANKPNGYVAFTGPDGDAFAKNSPVLANDVTASLWLLVRQGYISEKEYWPVTSVFVCPSSDQSADPLLNATGRRVKASARGNFRAGRYLSYSYCSAFTSCPEFRLTDSQKSRFAIMADKNPGIGDGSDVTRPSINAQPFEMAMANSRNHGRTGQNVLYATGTVLFEKSPYCGEGNDNIYTALAPMPIAGKPKDPAANGVCGRAFGPAHATDSYLVPTDADIDSSQFVPPPKPATTMATTTTAPATTQSVEPVTRPTPATTQATTAPATTSTTPSP